MGERYKAVLLFGAPGVGKGTQGKLLGAIPGLRHLATGDMFRGLDRQSDLGRRINAVMSSGALVSDDLTIELWRQHVQKMINAGQYAPQVDLLVLDGIPRSRGQAAALDPYIDVLLIVHLACPNLDEMVQRMERRAEKESRPDDADEHVIRRRFEVYERETKPVLSHYDRSLMREVSAVGTPARVLLNALEALVPVYDRHFGNPLG